MARRSPADSHPHASASEADATDALAHAALPLTALTPHPRNYNRHSDDQLASLQASLARFGQVRSIVVQEGAPGRYLIVAGHGLVEAAHAQGLTQVQADIIPATWTNAQVEGYLVSDNELARLSDPDYTALATLLGEQRDAGLDLLALGSSADDLQALLDQLADDALTPDPDDVARPTNGAQPSKRHLPLDCIFTVNGTGALCCLAVRAGFQYGINSAMTHGKVCAYTPTMHGHATAFVDNDYFAYDHAFHLRVVAEQRPKYATVRDIMTRAQCAEAGIEYFELAQILAWAEELEAHAQHVILIPKYDCLDALPARYVLGYSVPTSHGATPLPISAFAGRPVHLLGGSWSAQLAYMAELGDDVVSLDNNYIQKMATFGQFVAPDGTAHGLDELGPLAARVTNPLYIALALSLGNIGAKLHDLYPTDAPESDADGDSDADAADTDETLSA